MLRNRVWQTTTDSGSGAFTLGSAITGFQTFSSAFGSSSALYYITSRDYTEWECGYYVVNANTLARLSANVINGSSGPGVLVSFTGAGIKDVTNDIPAEILLGRKAADIASASSIDLGAAVGDVVDVTGTTAISALGTTQAGVRRWVRFTGTLTLTHNATSLILPAGANITTAAGDVALFSSLGAGNWVCLAYNRASGMALVGSSTITLSDATPTMNGSGSAGTGGSVSRYDHVHPSDTTRAALGVAQTFTAAQRGAPVTATDGATITLDFALANNFAATLAGNRTLANPSNLVAGQSGSIYVRQDATGSRTLAYAWGWQFAGGTAPTLTTYAGALDALFYDVSVASSATVTISIATPGVVSWTNHGLVTGQKVQLTTTGALPTGLAANTTYWVVKIDANSFSLASSWANVAAGTKISTSGSQSGVHTCAAVTILANIVKGVA